MSVSDIQKKINLLEKRLLVANTYKGNLEGLFTKKATCLYFYLLGDAYFLLNNVSNGQATTDQGVSIVDRCLESFEFGVSTAAESLEIIDRKCAFISQHIANNLFHNIFYNIIIH